MKTDSAHSRTLSRPKKACFAVVATALFFLCLEAILAALSVKATLPERDPFVGFESSIPLYVADSRDGQAWMRTADNKLAFFNHQDFPNRKPANTVRVFCVGGSTTFGRPYDDATSFSGWLRQLLPHADSSVNWEVINAGGISYASYRVAALMDELVKYSPDLFIIYTGHNEFLEERTYPGAHGWRATVRSSTATLLRTRTFSLAHRLLGSQAPDPRSVLPAEVDAILDHSVGPEAYHRDPALRAEILEHLQFNLHRMIQTARLAGAEVLMVKPAANLKDFSPFKSEHRGGISTPQKQAWADLVASADRLRAQGDSSGALATLVEAAKIDDTRADLNFRVGQLLFDQNQPALAREHFQQAIDNDVCPLRAITDIGRIIENTAITQRVPLVDLESIVSNDCLESFGHKCPGRDYFVDHVHPTVGTHRLLALSIIEAMTQSGSISHGKRPSQEAIVKVTDQILSHIDVEVKSRALTNLAQVLSWAGKQREAGPIAEQAVQLRAQAGLKDDAESMFYAAVGYAVDGRDSDAIDLLRKVARRRPDHSQARWRLAALLYEQQEYEEAKTHFAAVVELDPDDEYSRHMLGVVTSKLSESGG